MIARRVVIALGLAQLISWGATYYLIGGFGEQIAADLGWSRDIVYGGFAAALLVMGVASPLAGRWVDRSGGRQVMVAGAVINALGCAGLAVSHQIGSYFVSWIVLGLGMRLTLYDAAFAALARIGGPEARRAMSGITLLGGLAATVFWPFGHMLSDHFGWRIAVLTYAGIALLTIPLHLLIPNQRFAGAPGSAAAASRQPRAVGRRQLAAASGLYAVIMTGANFLNAGMSAHMIAVLTGLGLTITVAVWIATLRGIGQSAARLCEVLFGGRIDPLGLNLMACLIMPLSFVAGLFSGSAREMGIAFALLYGACNGILTITRGTLPLILFDHRSYGTLVGRLIVPSFILPAGAPLIYAIVIDRFGDASALYLSIGLALMTLLAAILLKLLFPPPLAAAKQ
ncbi:putative MFS family arabinose efflux permease [Bradyrhizobium japonicum]|uniref:MFS family arabinose efflux permease n=1 Tax=Bradyrhizobium elkanii TaxID=29448 RepID=A0ABV4EYT5_BRAEL|nr:MFS transporter [Bradyrhizobium elkanii]MCP1730561.1 putative MFS family arabinose efflux permease [Bradyrhizobium elkanii]MCP1757348.1 putative MFS family arabinose efflux permease [Bradyrhizobium elkanii]MCP1982861.1 putative MFS family arabinose efflux permease [Bradyrhizobium elkanii]MCS3574690.1 putative MFS family arabinose efflux permease [Bradyrhizobium elkanii]MCS3592619.1 putative MFS family arabinose efflux permease [Bradyrhizobium elkanii]